MNKLKKGIVAGLLVSAVALTAVFSGKFKNAKADNIKSTSGTEYERNTNLFVDSDMKELLGSYKSLKEAKKAALEKMNYSYDYEFILEKEENNIIWKSFKRIKLDPDMIVD